MRGEGSKEAVWGSTVAQAMSKSTGARFCPYRTNHKGGSSSEGDREKFGCQHFNLQCDEDVKERKGILSSAESEQETVSLCDTDTGRGK